MSKYAFEIWSRDGDLIADLSGLCEDRVITAARNKAETIAFSIDAVQLKRKADALHTTPAQLLSAGINEIRVRRGDNYLVGGRIDYHKSTLDGPDKNINVKATGFLNLLSERFLETQRLFTDTDMAQILWTVINESQTASANFWATPLPSAANADMGITQGTLETIGNKDRTYEAGKSLKDMVVQATELGTTPMDIEFTPEKVFSAYQRLGSDKPSLVFSYPRNIIKAELADDAQSLANRILTYGSGIGAGTRVQSIEEDSDSEINYRVRQHIQQFNAVEEEETLSDHGMGYLAAAKDPLRLPQPTVDLNKGISIDDFWVGDRLRFEIEDPALPVSAVGLYRVEALTLNIDDEDGENAKLTLSQ